MQQVSEVEQQSGKRRQPTPEELQIVGGEGQTHTQFPMPLIEIAELDKRVTNPGWWGCKCAATTGRAQIHRISSGPRISSSKLGWCSPESDDLANANTAD